MASVVALLESMWGWRGYNQAGEESPRYYRINPNNFSGRRLYRIVGKEHSLLVTNSCRMVQCSANHHGTPDPAWVLENLKFLRSEGMSLLLVCGKVAQATFESAMTTSERTLFPHIYMDHPAARRWSNETLDAMTQRVKEALQ